MRIPRGSAHDEQVDRRLERLYVQLASQRHVDEADEFDEVDDGEPREGNWAEGNWAEGNWAEVDDGGARLPVPGRHASRRAAERPSSRGRALMRILPGPLRGSAALGATQLTVVAVVVALGLAVTAWWVVRADPRTVRTPAATLETAAGDLVALSPVAAGAASPELGAAPGGVPAGEAPGGVPAGEAPVAGESATDGTVTSSATVTVDVAGKVRRPGVAVLPAGSRVVDAVSAAGGARRGVGLVSLNLARVLVDGEQVLVGPPPRGAPPTPAAGTSSAPGDPVGGTAPVDLNTADQSTLETLLQVGPVTAGAILAWREQHGSFSAVEELLEVDGIGEVTLAQIAPHAVV